MTESVDRNLFDTPEPEDIAAVKSDDKAKLPVKRDDYKDRIVTLQSLYKYTIVVNGKKLSFRDTIKMPKREYAQKYRQRFPRLIVVDDPDA